MVNGNSLIAKDNLPSFPETTSRYGEPAHDNAPQNAKQQQHKINTKHCDVEGYEEDKKEAPALKLEPQMPKVESIQAYFFHDEGDAQTEEKAHCLHTAQMRTQTEFSSAELSEHDELKNKETEAEEEQSMDLDVEVDEQEVADAAGMDVESAADLSAIAPPRPTLQRQTVLDESVDIVLPQPSRNSILVSTQAAERPKVRRWAIPSETRVGGVSSHLRYVAEKPRRRGLFRLF